jgi:hypothetical protein
VLDAARDEGLSVFATLERLLSAEVDAAAARRHAGLSRIAALGQPATMADLELLRDSAAADYLLQPVPDTDGPVTRLFHQALNDELLSNRHRTSDERAVQGDLRAAAAEDGWAAAPAYLRRHTAEHAAAAGELPALLDDVSYLAAADFTRLLPWLRPTPPTRTGQSSWCYGRSAPAPPRCPPTAASACSRPQQPTSD